jgi:translation initiation factor 1A
MKFKYGQENLRIPVPDEYKNEMFGIVSRVLGGSRMNVQSADGKSRLARIPGKMRRRVGRFRIGDLIILTPWDIQDEKADVLYRYRRNQIRFLLNRKLIPNKLENMI